MRRLCVFATLVALSMPVAAASAANAPRARVGAYYFDGWAGPLSSGQFHGLLDGPYASRRPLFGWRDAAPSTMSTQLGWAHSDGIGFFIFDWFHNAAAGRVPDDRFLNTSLENYRKVRHHHGVKYAVLYVNDGPFRIQPDEWESVAEELVTVDFASPNYERVRGKPVFFILNSFAFTLEQGGADGVNRAFSTLRQVAREHGLPGVFIVAGIAIALPTDWPPDAYVDETYDAVTQYGYPSFAGILDGEHPYGDLVTAEEGFWTLLGATSHYPYIPDVMAGWDTRPIDEELWGHLWWFRRSPAEVGAFTHDAVLWARAHAQANVEPRHKPPMVLIEAWNEFSEGSQILPTVAEGYSYGKAVAKAVGVLWRPARYALDVHVDGRGRVVSSPRGITCPGTCTAMLAQGTAVSLHASSARGRTFGGWSGGCAGRWRSCTRSMTTDVDVGAHFTG
jgi:glycosyl transferase family WbsX/List-Bact-rpt repeat protein